MAQPDYAAFGDRVQQKGKAIAGELGALRSNVTRTLMIGLDEISANPDNVRKTFDQEKLDELASSIRDKGVLQAILVAQKSGGGYELIAGERRWRAARLAGLDEIPAVVRDGADAAEVNIIENIQREDLNPLELAEKLERLQKERGYRHEDLAAVLGKSRGTITELLSLNKLPQEIRDECRALDNPEIGTKTKLLQLVRAETPEQRAALWTALKSGEATTLRQIQARRLPKQSPAAANYTYSYKPESGAFRLNLTFPKAEVSAAEVRAALQEALNGLA